MFDANLLLTGIIFSSIGMGYFIYGKKQGRSIPLLSGMLLMVYPYFITDITYVMMIGIVLILLPLVIKFEF